MCSIARQCVALHGISRYSNRRTRRALAAGVNREMFHRVFDGLWWTVVTMTSVGYGDKYPVTAMGKIFAIALMVTGVVVTSIFSGTIASIFVDKKIREGKGLQEINLKHHIVICGWNRNAESILAGLEKLSTRSSLGVVLISEIDPEHFQTLKTRYPDLDLRFIRGDFTNETALKRGVVNTAKAAIVLSDSSGHNTLANADERTILTTLAIKSLSAEITTSAELVNSENAQHLKRANIDDILVNGEFSGFLFATSTFAKGVPDLVKEVLSFEGKSEFGSVEKSMVKPDFRYVSFFGDMAMFEDEPRSATITASTACLLYGIKRRDFENFCVENPMLGVKILQSVAAALCKRIRKGNQDVLKLSTALSVALSK